jgi:hypothetical protein
MRRERRSLALIELITVYVVFPIFSAFVLALALVVKSTFLFSFGAIYMLLFAWIAVRKVRYDSNFLSTIDIKEAPSQITQLLSETTSRGILINQLIIETLDENPQISQTELYKKLPIQPAIRPTKERVRQFAKKLQDLNIIRDIAPNVREGRNCVYVLTERGKWCVSAINQYYPRYYVTFLVRVILKTHFRKELPSFESLKND